MAKRHHNPRLVKIHRNYTVEEIATVLGIHRNTVHRWIKDGLSVIDSKRPKLVHGRELAAFLQARKAKNKRPCKPGQIYCVRCRTPQDPADAMAECQVQAGNLGNLVGICPMCDGLIYRRVNVTKLAQVQGNLEITLAHGSRHISEREMPSVNGELNLDG